MKHSNITQQRCGGQSVLFPRLQRAAVIWLKTAAGTHTEFTPKLAIFAYR